MEYDELTKKALGLRAMIGAKEVLGEDTTELKQALIELEDKRADYIFGVTPFGRRL